MSRSREQKRDIMQVLQSKPPFTNPAIHLAASYYKGETAAKLLESLDHQMQYRGKTQRGILDSWFFTLYFFPLYERFDEDKTYTLPFLPKLPKILFEITLSVHEEISESRKFLIMAKGKCTDPRTAAEISNGKTIHRFEGRNGGGTF